MDTGTIFDVTRKSNVEIVKKAARFDRLRLTFKHRNHHAPDRVATFEVDSDDVLEHLVDEHIGLFHLCETEGEKIRDSLD